jgi:hypothetical protein
VQHKAHEASHGIVDQEVLARLVERVTFHNVENGFWRGHRDLVTVVGHSATIAAGEWITATKPSPSSWGCSRGLWHHTV